MAESTYLPVCEDLDTIRRSLPPETDLTPALARLLAACSGTLRHITIAPEATPDADPGADPDTGPPATCHPGGGDSARTTRTTGGDGGGTP